MGNVHYTYTSTKLVVIPDLPEQAENQRTKERMYTMEIVSDGHKVFF